MGLCSFGAKIFSDSEQMMISHMLATGAKSILLAAAAEQATGAAINLGSGTETSINTLAELVGDAVGHVTRLCAERAAKHLSYSALRHRSACKTAWCSSRPGTKTSGLRPKSLSHIVHAKSGRICVIPDH